MSGRSDKETKKFISWGAGASNSTLPHGGEGREKQRKNKIVSSVAALRDYILHDIVNNSANLPGTYNFARCIRN